jgi:hypothetical protein
MSNTAKRTAMIPPDVNKPEKTGKGVRFRGKKIFKKLSGSAGRFLKNADVPVLVSATVRIFLQAK